MSRVMAAEAKNREGGASRRGGGEHVGASERCGGRLHAIAQQCRGATSKPMEQAEQSAPHNNSLIALMMSELMPQQQ